MVHICINNQGPNPELRLQTASGKGTDWSLLCSILSTRALCRCPFDFRSNKGAQLCTPRMSLASTLGDGQEQGQVLKDLTRQCPPYVVSVKSPVSAPSQLGPPCPGQASSLCLTSMLPRVAPSALFSALLRAKRGWWSCPAPPFYPIKRSRTETPTPSGLLH